MPIFDQGYQHWKGPLSGHGWRWLAIARHGVRVQLRNRILLVILLMAWLPALALVIAVAIWGLVEQKNASVMALVQFLPAVVLQDPVAFRAAAWTLSYSFFFKFEMFFIMLLVVVAGPGLISRDLRFNALPLYFSRPLTRFDYFAGKMVVIGALVAAVAVAPALFAYVVGVCFSLDFSVVKDTYSLLLGSAAQGLVITLSAGLLMLALSSLTRRSLFVGIAWAGMWIISGSVASIMIEVNHQSVRRSIHDEEMTGYLAIDPPPPGVQMDGTRPRVQWRAGKVELIGPTPEENSLAEQWYERWMIANQVAFFKGELGQGEAARTDWRPLLSYTANLNRLADQMLDTDAAWVKFGKAAADQMAGMPRPGRGGMGPRAAAPPPRLSDRWLADRWVPQFPWWWSAGVLLGLMGISTWTLTMRVKSLDRLK